MKKQGFYRLSFMIGLGMLLLGIFSAGIAITAPKTTPSNRPVIGATFLGPSEFPTTIRNYMIKEAQKRKVTLLTYDGGDKPQIQIEQVREMIRRRVDVIILNPVDADRCVECVNLAMKAGIPVLGVNAMVKSDQLLTYIGSNDIEAGEIEMKFMAEKIKGEGNIVVMDGVTGQSSQIQRTQGILNVLRGYPKIRILEETSGNWLRAQGYTLMREWLRKYGLKINAVVSQNDEMALGAIRCLKEEKLPGKFPIVGIDAIPDALTALRNGELNATVFQDAEGQGRLSVDLAIKIFKHESIAKTYFIPFRLVTQENMAEYLRNLE